MDKFNFNVGDKVINLSELSLWDNVFHFEKFENHFICTVTHANERYFSISFFDVNQKKNFCGSDLHHVYCQEDGKWCDYDPSSITRLYHFERDKDKVIAHMNKLFDEALKKSDDEDAKEIQSLENQIQFLQSRIQLIKDGKRPSIKPAVAQKEFLAERQQFILSKLYQK